MVSPALDAIQAALATVNDPEIRRPITELGMVDSVEAGDDGVVHVKVLLTVAGCPLKDTITRDVNAALAKVPGVTAVDLTLGVMSPEQRSGLQQQLRGGQAQKEIPFAKPGAPGNVSAATVANKQGSVQVSWERADDNGRPVTRYVVKANDTETEVTDTSATLSGFGDDTAVTVTVSPCRAPSVAT